MGAGANTGSIVSKKTVPLIFIVALTGLGIGVGLSVLAMPMLQDMASIMKTEQGFLIYIIIMTSLAVLLLLVMFVLMELRMQRVMSRLDEISESASQFVKLGMELTRKAH